ncbi:hypothetical protein, partial [Lactobacillus sp. ESL0247]|uniref:hypothetical protein n=1 Tax=Lactobacillus sp. ESL0247 TaxID=2069360 RepID=UPI001F18F515
VCHDYLRGFTGVKSRRFNFGFHASAALVFNYKGGGVILKALIAKFFYRRVQWFWLGLSILLAIAFATCLYFTIKTYHDFNTWKMINLY